MKINKILFVLALIFSVNLGSIASSEAFEFNIEEGKARLAKAIADAKKALENEYEKNKSNSNNNTTNDVSKVTAPKVVSENKASANNDFVVENSQFNSSQVFPANSTWALLKITKDQYIEEQILPVKDGILVRPIFLKNGDGDYQIKIYATSNIKKYGISYTYINKLNIQNRDDRDLTFLLPSEEVQSDNPNILKLALKLTESLDNDTDKVKKIHDYVAYKITYNMQGYLDGTYVNNPTDALSVLNNPITVCAGYANLFAALSRAAHIRTSIVYGKATVGTGTGDHAWNEVQIDGEWRIIDVTWDDIELLRYDYFFPTLEEFSKDHQKTEVRNDL
jgi:transglutaminase/protease-like cytokinesis protein 3